MSYPPQSSYGPAYGHGAPPDYGHSHHGHDPHRSSPYSQPPPSHAPSPSPQYDSRGPPPDSRAPDHYHYDAHRGPPPSSSGSYQQPSSGSYQQPSSGGADPHQAHHDYYRQYGSYPPSSYSSSGHGSSSYPPPDSGSYPPPTSGGYPPQSSGYQAPSSGYPPPASGYEVGYGQHQGYPPQSGHTEPPAQSAGGHYPPPANYGSYPPPAYGAPPPAYGAPPPAYGAPPGYGAPPPGYGAPMPGYPPHPGYAAPALGYGPPTAAYFPPPGPPPGGGGGARRNSPRRDGKERGRGGGKGARDKERRPNNNKPGDAKGRIQQLLHTRNDWVALWLEGFDPPSRMASASNVTMLLISRKGRQRNNEDWGFLSTVSRESQKKKDRERDCARDLVAVLDQLQFEEAKSWYQLPSVGDAKKDVETADLDELAKVVKRRMPHIVVEIKEPESFVLAASSPFGPNEKGVDAELDILEKLDTGFGELLAEAKRVSGLVRKQWWVATVVAKPTEMKDDSRAFTLGVGVATDKGIAKARAVFASGKRASVLTDKMFVKEKETKPA